MRQKSTEDLLKKGAEQQKQADDMIEGLKNYKKRWKIIL